MTEFTEENSDTASSINREEKDLTKTKIRFKEVNQERALNDIWKANNNVEDIYYTEIKENQTNFEECQEAKDKELKNMDDFKVYEEVKDTGQYAMDTRYVLTEKADGSIKARLVVKGFQEQTLEQSDSPTASRDTLKVFCSIAANEKWEIEGSDVRSAFFFIIQYFRS